MERQIHPGQLSDAAFARATAADDADIRALLREVPMRGALQVGFAREPSFFANPAPAGEMEHTLVARRDGRLLSVGSWSEREVWLGGRRENIGYLHGLRMAEGTAGSMQVLREGYAALAREIADSQARGWFTSIDATNTRARRVLESRVSGLPRYRKIADYHTRVFPVRRGGISNHSSTEEELTSFLNQHGARHDLAMAWDDARWRALALSGFTPDDVVVVRRKDRIVAAAGVWDPSAWKQVVIHQYPRWAAWVRPLLKLPDAGKALRLGYVFPFAVDDEKLLSEIWSGLTNIARKRGIDWLALGLDANDPLWQHTRRIGVSYRTILYWVCGSGFPGPLPMESGRLVRPDCAML
jgi:hypothetical protein